MTTVVPARGTQGRAVVPQAARIGQSTAVEQTRAAAEVAAMVQVAQQCPRNELLAFERMREMCSQIGLAERAFYSYPRGGETVTGASVYLARALASVWGNLQYGVTELRRDDEGGESEMQAYAWDMQSNTRHPIGFIVPHKRDTKRGVKALTDMRDIYENNANAGARRVRECIFAMMPPHFVDEAKGICSRTLERGEPGVTLNQRIGNLLDAFGRLGVSVTRLEEKTGRRQAEWTGREVASLGVIWKSIDRRELTVDEAFPDERLTAEDLVGAPDAQPAQPARQRTQKPAAQSADHPQARTGHTWDEELGEYIPDSAGVDPAQFAGGA